MWVQFYTQYVQGVFVAYSGLLLASYGSIGLPCGLASTQRVYLCLYLVPNEQNHSMYS